MKDLKKEVDILFDTLSYDVEVQIIGILIEQSKSEKEQIVIAAFEWILLILQKYKYHFIQHNQKIRSPYTKSSILVKHLPLNNGNNIKSVQPFISHESSMSHFSSVSYDPLASHEGENLTVNITSSNLTSCHNDNVNCGESKVPMYLLPKILEVIICNINHTNIEIRKLTTSCNNEILSIIDFYWDLHSQNIKLFEETLKLFFHETNEQILELVLAWINKLFKKFHEEMFNKVDDFIEDITQMISNSNDSLFNNILDTICQIAKYREEYTEIILINILKNLKANKTLLNTKGVLILKKLCAILQVDRVYYIFADVLLKMDVKL